MSTFHQTAKNADQIAPDGATDATVVHFEHFFVGVHHEIVVDPFLTEFIDDHGVSLAVPFGENPVQKGRLARAEKAGEHRNGRLSDLIHGEGPSDGWRIRPACAAAAADSMSECSG